MTFTPLSPTHAGRIRQDRVQEEYDNMAERDFLRRRAQAIHHLKAALRDLDAVLYQVRHVDTPEDLSAALYRLMGDDTLPGWDRVYGDTEGWIREVAHGDG
jgi:hypothetical protein